MNRSVAPRPKEAKQVRRGKPVSSPMPPPAFTLLELLVVIALISILAGLLLPALAGAKEKARRSACRNTMRQLLVIAHLYGDDHQQWLPSGASDKGTNDDHLPLLSTATYANLSLYGAEDRLLYCPGFLDFFKSRAIESDERNYGVTIGYNYHGGHANTPWPALVESNTWVSPRRLTEDSRLVLLSDLNDWSPGYLGGRTFVPHSRGGALQQGGDYSNAGAAGVSSAALGATGGNLGSLDGSVLWRNAGQMRIYRGSQLYERDGCWAMW